MMTRRLFACAASLSGLSAGTPDRTGGIRLIRLPEDGIQPQVAVDDRGTLHVVYYKGDAHHGDLLYVRSSDFGATFSAACR